MQRPGGRACQGEGTASTRKGHKARGAQGRGAGKRPGCPVEGNGVAQLSKNGFLSSQF